MTTQSLIKKKTLFHYVVVLMLKKHVDQHYRQTGLKCYGLQIALQVTGENPVAPLATRWDRKPKPTMDQLFFANSILPWTCLQIVASFSTARRCCVWTWSLTLTLHVCKYSKLLFRLLLGQPGQQFKLSFIIF